MMVEHGPGVVNSPPKRISLVDFQRTQGKTVEFVSVNKTASFRLLKAFAAR